jgi:simple sugar transport system permease protein
LGLRAVGENPNAAFASGRDPAVFQYQALCLGGVLGGLAGAHLSLSVTGTWAEYMTAGRGFIAIALVIFSKWDPLRVIAGTLVFGGAEALELQLQARGSQISPFLLEMFPYLLTIAVLLAWGGSRRLAAPASLGRTFYGSS